MKGRTRDQHGKKAELPTHGQPVGQHIVGFALRQVFIVSILNNWPDSRALNAQATLGSRQAVIVGSETQTLN